MGEFYNHGYLSAARENCRFINGMIKNAPFCPYTKKEHRKEWFDGLLDYARDMQAIEIRKAIR